MKVHELIERLGSMPQDMVVVTPGFDESGFDLVDAIEVIQIVRSKKGGVHSGAYDKVKYCRDPAGDPFLAVLINF